MWEFIAIGLFGIACFAGGWYTKGRLGAQVAAVVTAVETPPKP